VPPRDPLIRHAITPPAFDRGKLSRDRLVDAIHANIPRKLIAIATPPGYGKTTLLADFGQQTDLNVCWFRLSEGDWDVMRFAQVLAASLQERFRRLRGQPDLAALANASPEALALAFSSLIEERVSETFVIVFDDVHLINNSPPVLSFMDAFLDTLPEQVTVITAGREVVEVSLAKLMAEGDLAGLGPHDLALNREELAELSRTQFGAVLSEQELDHVLEETRGWVTGVVMSGAIADAALGSVLGAGRPMVYEYLASVVLNRQPDDLRRFALDSAVLPVMTIEACDHVLQRGDSQRQLTRLVRKGVFLTSTEGTPRFYEYHPQFRQFLIESLEGSDPRRHRRLRLRAAQYLEQHESPEQAVDLYLEAGSPGRAALLAERNAQRMRREGRLQTLQSWADRLEAAGAKVPDALVHLSGAYHDRGDALAAEAALERADRMIGPKTRLFTRAQVEIARGFIALYQEDWAQVRKSVKKAEKLLARRADRLQRARCLRLQSWVHARADRDFTAAEDCAKKAVDLLAQSDDKYGLAIAMLDLGVFQYSLGKTMEGNATNQRALEYLQEHGEPSILALAYNNRAVDLHSAGQYLDAMDYFQEGLKFARRAANRNYEARILLGQADLFNDLDLALQAAELYGQALTLATQLDNSQLIRYGCIQTSVLHRRRGGTSLAHEWLKRAMVVGPADEAPVPAVIQLAALECEAAPEHAVATLEGLLHDSDGTLEPAERVLAQLFLARAAFRSGNREQASEALGEAVSSAGAAGEEQALAAELVHHSELRDLAAAALGKNPVYSVALSRIETMRALAQQFQTIEEEETASSQIDVAALGTTQIRTHGRELTELKPLTRELLIYLIDRQRISRDQLMEAFWPHHLPGRQTSNLHTAVYSIRQALGKDAVLLEGAVYMMNPDLPVEYDVARFEHAAGLAESLPQGDPRRMFALTEAVSSYRGTFLSEFDSQWVVDRRRMLEMRYIDLLGEHSAEALVKNQLANAANSLREILRLEPFRDEANSAYMEVLGQLGRRGDIVAHYQEYRRLLAEELGLDPPEEMSALYGRLIG
jgi:LuxR family maltose regulon positive regulatory protein